MIKHFRNKLFFSLFLIVILILIGSFWYHYYADFSWVDAIYMTIITATTVGFGEVHQLNDQSKIFTIFLIIASIMVYAYTITTITEYVISGKLFQNLIKKRMDKKIKKIRNHIIIIGYGRNGKQALNKLQSFHKSVIVIDKNKPKDNKVFLEKNVIFIEGDATNDEVLIDAGIKNAHTLLSTLSTDADNLFVVLSAKQINPGLNIISRASNERAKRKMKLAGATNVIMPEIIGGDYMASLVVTPDLVEFLNRLSMEDSGEKNNLVEIYFEELPKKYQGKSIADLDLRKKTGCNVIGFKTNDNQYHINPAADTVLEKDTAIIVLGQPYQIEQLNRFFNLKKE